MENLSWQLIVSSRILIGLHPQVWLFVTYLRILENERGGIMLSELWKREGSEIRSYISFTIWNTHTPSEANSTSWGSLFHFQTTLLITTPCTRHWAEAQKVVLWAQTIPSQPEQLHFYLSKQYKVSINILIFHYKFMLKQGLLYIKIILKIIVFITKLSCWDGLKSFPYSRSGWKVCLEQLLPPF